MTVFRVGEQVQEIASPHRKGRITQITGSGVNQLITVSLAGWHPAQYRNWQLRPA